jgi:hypothetical protein
MTAPFSITRRSLVAGAVGTVALGSSTAIASTGSYSGISVDVADLRRLGLGPYAEFVRGQMARAMQASFAGRLGGRGALSLVVRVSAVTLASYVGSSGNGGNGRYGIGGGTESSDYLEGEALVLNGRAVLRRHPQLVTLPSSSGGPSYLPNNEQKRTAALCDAYAQWLARAL